MGRRTLSVLVALLVLVCAGCATGETGSTVVLSESGASVDGRITSSVGGPVEYWVQYGPTTAYGGETAHATETLEPNTPRIVFVVIDGLARETEYHYRLCASDSQQGAGGPGCGADRTLVTESVLCGATVTASVRLTGDVLCNLEDGPALIVGADGIDIDLAGHRLGVQVSSGGGQLAIRNEVHSDVTIRNGTVDGTIDLRGASRNLLRDIQVSSTGTAININGGQGNEFRASRATARGSAVSAIDSDGVVVAGSQVTATLGAGIQVVGERARIVRNRAVAGTPNLLRGIELSGSDGRIAGNSVTGGWLAAGILLEAGARNVIAENEVSDIRFPVGQPDDRFGDGIVVAPSATGTLVRRNLAQRNDGDGIDVGAAGTRLRDNSAFDNRLLGINAVPGVTDLGGNRAHGNGDPLQCRNVFCAP
jgi:Right handed beta helix region